MHDFSEMVLRDQLKFVLDLVNNYPCVKNLNMGFSQHGWVIARNRSNFNSFERKLIPTQSRILVSNARLLASSKTVIWFGWAGVRG